MSWAAALHDYADGAQIRYAREQGVSVLAMLAWPIVLGSSVTGASAAWPTNGDRGAAGMHHSIKYTDGIYAKWVESGMLVTSLNLLLTVSGVQGVCPANRQL